MDMRKKNILIGLGELIGGYAVTVSAIGALVTGLAVTPLAMAAAVIAVGAGTTAMFKGGVDAMDFAFFPELRQFGTDGKLVEVQAADKGQNNVRCNERNKQEQTVQPSLSQRREERNKTTSEPTNEPTGNTNEYDHKTKRDRVSSTYDYGNDDWFYSKQRDMQNNPENYGM